MWKYTELDAYDTISLHDCKANSITMDGSNLIFDFPDGFWITPASSYIDRDCPIKTGPAQLCIHGIFEEALFDAIDIYIKPFVYWESLFYVADSNQTILHSLRCSRLENMNWSLSPNTTQQYLPFTNAGYGKRIPEFMQNVSLNLLPKVSNTAGMKFVMIMNGN